MTTLGNWNPPERSTASTRSSGGPWHARIKRYEYENGRAARDLAESTPKNAKLLEWASRPTAIPPQSWWDETTDPFQPTGE